MEQHAQADGGPGSAFSAEVPDVVDPAVDPASAESPDGFLNEPLDVTGLPLLESEEFESLHPNYLRVRLIGDAIFAGIVIIGAAVAAFLATWWWLPLIIGAVLLALTALAAWLQTIEVGHIGYLVREKDFSFRSGVINRNVTTVPFARVQHVSIDRGPLARAFGLATLAMRTAGDGLTVPGMGEEVAAKLKALVVDRAGALADAEYSDGDLAPASQSPASQATASQAPASQPTAPPQDQPAGDWVPPMAEHD